jgi:ribosomal-protein-alanine N-acetyltransferase
VIAPSSTPLTLTPYHRRYLQPIRDFIFQNPLVHVHFDWYESDHWLESLHPPARLAWQNGRLTGFIAATAPREGWSWLRMLGLRNYGDRRGVLRTLWADLQMELRSLGTERVALLGTEEWTGKVAPEMGFRFVENVITMQRLTGPLPPPQVTTPLRLRAAEPWDLEAMLRVDQAAFEAPWNLTPEELRQGFRQSFSTTVAELNGELVGYSFSTAGFGVSHLARLCTHSVHQGVGVGGALLRHSLERLGRYGSLPVTLNTQSSNVRSQRLYARFGFQPNGYDLPFMVARLSLPHKDVHP